MYLTTRLVSSLIFFFLLFFGICREFVETMLPAFKQKFPQYEVATEIRKGKHPYVRGDYGKLELSLRGPK